MLSTLKHILLMTDCFFGAAIAVGHAEDWSVGIHHWNISWDVADVASNVWDVGYMGGFQRMGISEGDSKFSS